MVPIAFSAAGNMPGLAPGIALSLVTFMGYSGILFAPSLIGFLAEHTSFHTIFTFLPALFLVVLLLSGLARHADMVRENGSLAAPRRFERGCGCAWNLSRAGALNGVNHVAIKTGAVMPAKSKAQQKAAGAALSAKRGETKKSSLKGASRQMAELDEQARAGEFAETDRKNLPNKKKDSGRNPAGSAGRRPTDGGTPPRIAVRRPCPHVMQLHNSHQVFGVESSDRGQPAPVADVDPAAVQACQYPDHAVVFRTRLIWTTDMPSVSARSICVSGKAQRSLKATPALRLRSKTSQNRNAVLSTAVHRPRRDDPDLVEGQAPHDFPVQHFRYRRFDGGRIRAAP